MHLGLQVEVRREDAGTADDDDRRAVLVRKCVTQHLIDRVDVPGVDLLDKGDAHRPADGGDVDLAPLFALERDARAGVVLLAGHSRDAVVKNRDDNL